MLGDSGLDVGVVLIDNSERDNYPRPQKKDDRKSFIVWQRIGLAIQNVILHKTLDQCMIWVPA